MSERQRSHWGWGFIDRFPDDERRRLLAMQIGGLLGIPEPSLLPLPDAGVAQIAEPRLAPPPELSHLGRADRATRMSHTFGRGYRDLVRGFRGAFSPAPDWVAFPANEDEVQRILAWASSAEVAVIPWGGGTSVVRGVEAEIGARFRGAVSIDLGKMDRVLEVDPVSRAARIQAGARGPVLEEQLAGHGLSLRHYPQSFELSTLGGWIVTRAGGHFATLYTHIDDLVQSVRMVTPAGELVTRRLPASGAGPAPERLVLGSEGTLGVVTEAWMRVFPRPRWRASASVRFARFEDGVAAARAVAQAGLYPANCRLLDPLECMLHSVPADGGSMLLLAFESADHPLEPWLGRAVELAVAAGGVLADAPRYRDDGSADGAGAREGAGGSWRRSFLDAPYLQTALVSLGVVVDTFETACTWDRFPALHLAVGEAVRGAMQAACGGGVLSCRFTHVYPDGPAPYYTFIAPGCSGEEEARWQRIKDAACAALVDNGATITHHHAVGREHRAGYERERAPLFADVLRAAKRTLDPAGVLNPGVLIADDR
jgi:alkyldihydroxyacetonephosphate synthase